MGKLRGPDPNASQFGREWASGGKVCIHRLGYLSLHLNCSQLFTNFLNLRLI